jgi:membrane protein
MARPSPRLPSIRNSKVHRARAVLTQAASDWLKHRDARLGAALAYYSVFSLGPLLLIVVAITGLFFGEDSVRASLSAQFQSLLGPVGSQAIDAMLKGAGTVTGGRITAVIGVVLLFIAATGVVAQLKDALNTIWEVEEPATAGWWSYIRTYLVSFAGILGLGFLLAVSLVVNAGLAAVSGMMGGGEAAFWQAVDLVVSFAVMSTLFAMLFKWFPDADVQWRHALAGGATTALLFAAGKLAISWYIGTQGLESTYGAAASVVVLLIWVYYSAQIVLFGAEITHAAGKPAQLRQG